MMFIYLSMPKFHKKVEDLDNRFEKWMYVLKNLKRLDSLPDKLRGKVFEKIFATAEIAKLSKEEYKEYIVSLNAYRDFKNSIETARDEGKAEGKIEGKIEGRAEGLAFGEQERLKLEQRIAELERQLKEQSK